MCGIVAAVAERNVDEHARVVAELLGKQNSFRFQPFNPRAAAEIDVVRLHGIGR